MPASRQRSRSPSMALAVRAMIGTRRPWPLRPANSPGGLIPVNPRHLAIHQDQIVAFGSRQPHRLQAVARTVNEHPSRVMRATMTF